MKIRYSRNRIYVNEEEQDKVSKVRILLGGAGIGSIIAECALRFGFENITIVDGDKVEETNLNRQNYTYKDIGRYKAEVLRERLLEINPYANISCKNEFITRNNLTEIVTGHDIAVNALDFKDSLPFLFDDLCSESGIPVFHPYNLGWAGFLTVAKPGGPQMIEISREPIGFELKVAAAVAEYLKNQRINGQWLIDVIEKYAAEKGTLPPPQLSAASWIVAGHCVNAMFNVVTGKEIKYFPEFYVSSLLCESKA